MSGGIGFFGGCGVSREWVGQVGRLKKTAKMPSFIKFGGGELDRL